MRIAPRTKFLFACAAAVAAAFGCRYPWEGQPTGPTIVITNTQTVGQSPGPSASPSTAPTGCPTPQSIRLGGCAQGVKVGESCDLSLTPFLAPGVPSPASCDDLRHVEWISTAVCSVITAGSNKYTPSLKGVGVGVCKVHALVDGVRSDQLDVEIR